MKKVITIFLMLLLIASAVGASTVASAESANDLYYYVLADMDGRMAVHTDYDKKDKVQGDGCTVSSITYLGVLQFPGFRLGAADAGQKTLNVDASSVYTHSSQMALAFWVKMSDPFSCSGGDIQLNSIYTSYPQGDDEVGKRNYPQDKSLVWKINDFRTSLVANQWTWVVLPFFDAFNNVVDGRQRTEEEFKNIVSNIHYFTLYTGAVVDFTIKLDQIRIIRTDLPGATDAPKYDGTDTRVGEGSGDYMYEEPYVTPVTVPEYYKFLNCDSDFQNFGIDTYYQKEGDGCVRAIGSAGLVDIYAGMSVAPFGSRADGETMQDPMPDRKILYAEGDASIGLWISYDSNIDITTCSGALQLGSSNCSDNNLYSIPIISISYDIKNQIENNTHGDSWAWITFPLARAVKIGEPDLTKLNFFRIYLLNPDKTNTMTLRIDDVRIFDNKVKNAALAPTYSDDCEILAAGDGEYISIKKDRSFNYTQAISENKSEINEGYVLKSSWVIPVILGVVNVLLIGLFIFITIYIKRRKIC